MDREYCLDVNDKQQCDAVLSVLEARDKQDAKWGQQNHGNLYWIGILMEEVGELAKEVANEYLSTYGLPQSLEHNLLYQMACQIAETGLRAKTVIETPCFAGNAAVFKKEQSKASVRLEAVEELTQTAAVAIAWLECIKRSHT